MAKGTGKIDNILSTLGTNNSSQIATAVLAGFKMFFIPAATAMDKQATPEQKKYTMTRDVITEGLALTTYLGITGQVQKHATAPICSSYYKHKAKMLEAGKIKPVSELTSDEIDFLKHVDYKKINAAGVDALTKKSAKHVKMTSETEDYIVKLNNIVQKVNGRSKDVSSVPLNSFLNDLHKNGIPNEKKGLSVLVGDFKNAAKGTKDIADPIKLFQNTRIALSQVCVWTLALAVIPPLCNAIITPVMKKINSYQKTKDEVKNPIKSTTSINSIKKPNGKKTIEKHNYYANMTNVGNMRV